jgi:CDGSH-type Zn-finger protein
VVQAGHQRQSRNRGGHRPLPLGCACLPAYRGGAETAPGENTAVITNAGPLYLRGDLAVEGASDDMPGVRVRAALCRCGASARKPSCDGSHEKAEFDDRGAVGQTGDPQAPRGGPLTVTPSQNGPFVVNGNLTIVAASGREAWHGSKTALCRCGQSSNKPFCDGTHSKVGFTT